MTSSSKTCWLCFSDIENENFEIVDTKYIFDVLLTNLNVDESSKHILCSACARSVLTAFTFKTTCVQTDTAIMPYVDWESGSQLDLREVYLKERENDQSMTNLSEEDEVCRLCMRLIDNQFMYELEEMDTHMLERFLPNMNMMIVKDPVVCKSCFDSFEEHCIFLNNYLDVEEELETSEDDVNSLDSDEIIEEELSVDYSIKLGDLKTICEEDEQKYIKMEEIDVKFEDYSESSSENHQTAILESKFETDDVGLIESYKEESQIEVEAETASFNCNLCEYKTKMKIDFIQHLVLHREPFIIEIEKSDECNPEEEDDVTVISDDEPVNPKSEQKKLTPCVKYKCDECAFETKYKGSLKSHKVLHKDPSELQMYECDVCDYKAKFKGTLQSHQLRHKDPSQVQMYRCDICDYESRYKRCVLMHQKVHASSQGGVFKCKFCDYTTSRKNYLASHMRVHDERKEAYTCNICKFTTRFKGPFTMHILAHKDRSEVWRFKCDKCKYATKYKSHLSKHEMRHQRMSEECKYSCDKCSFTTMRKQFLRLHTSSHNNPFRKYKCEDCGC